MDDPFVPLDCYYLGYLEEDPLSMVTMDTDVLQEPERYYEVG